MTITVGTGRDKYGIYEYDDYAGDNTNRSGVN